MDRRSRVRILFSVGVVALAVTSGLAALAMLRPPGPPREILLGRADRVRETPQLLRIPQLDELSAIARQRRGSWMVRTSLAPIDARGIYLIRDEGGAVRAFLAADPRTGCALEWREPRFHDVCHGSTYDRNGTVLGGPSPWALDEAILVQQGDLLFALTTDVRPGACLNCEASRSDAPPDCDLKGIVGLIAADQ